MAPLWFQSPLVRNNDALTWGTASSSSFCGTPFSLAMESRSQQSCRPRHTHHCRSLPQPPGTLCLGKPPSALRWRRPPGCGLLELLQSQAVVRERKKTQFDQYWSGLTEINDETAVTEQAFTYVIELRTVTEHEIDVSDKLIRWGVMDRIPFTESGSYHRQIHWPLYDLIIMTCLHDTAFTCKSLAIKLHLNRCDVWK